MPISQDLRAARNMDFAPTLNTYYFGDPLPLTGADVKLEVRLYPGATGDPLASDEAVDFADALVGQAIDPTDGVLKDQRCLMLNPSIVKASLAAMPGFVQAQMAAAAVLANLPAAAGPEVGDDQIFSYEIMLIYSDALRDQLWVGSFILEPGVVA